jgi:DNA-binding NtrC family response regulator
MRASLLWVHDNSAFAEEYGTALEACGLVFHEARRRLEFRNLIRQLDFDAVLLTLPTPLGNPEDLLDELRLAGKDLPVVLHDPHSTITPALRLARYGALCHTVGAVSAEELREVVRTARREYQTSGPERRQEPWREFLIGESRTMRQVFDVIRLVAGRKCTVLLTGETGVGKEVVARAIHAASDRSHLPMVAVNCAALPDNLLEAELFGHTRGAFTGAVAQRVGRFEQAQRSTILLDEVGEMPLQLQVKLLRVLQERELQRVGSSENVKIDVRVIAASNSNLREAVSRGDFRKDLYYRLNVVPVHVPALRDRLSDVPLLAEHLMEKICRREGLPHKRITEEAEGELQEYSWPGNVRELEHALERAIALSGDRRTLQPHDFDLCLDGPVSLSASSPVIELPDDGLDFEETMTRIERTLLEQALQRSGGNKARAAGMLGMKRTTLMSKVKALGYCAG